MECYEKINQIINKQKICGVCGGIAEYFNVDPTLVRLLCAVAIFCSFFTEIFAYFVAAIIIPEQQ